MARDHNRLSARRVATAGLNANGGTGWHADGLGLYLKVSAASDGGLVRSWVFRFKRGGRERWAGLGPLHDVSLAKAREAAHSYRAMLREGLDPLDERDAQLSRRRLEAAKAITFEQAVKQFIDEQGRAWKNAKHRQQWTNTLCIPSLARLPIGGIDKHLVARALKPIWETKPETASRVRGRIERVLAWATAHGYREGDNPAALELQKHLLPAQVRTVKHHAALPYAQMPAFVVELCKQDLPSARALLFAILTWSRTNEVIGARPEEFDWKAATWTIPANRMKAGREHVVPLSTTALLIAKESGGRFELSNMGMLELVKRMGLKGQATPHGLARSTSADWALEQYGATHELIDAALAHKIANKVTAAYVRATNLERRREMLNGWAAFALGEKVRNPESATA